jgi:hypothetical protein
VFGIPAVLTVVGYVAFYACDARLRSRHGPWAVTFGTNPAGTPTLRIDQPSLGISGVEVRFPGESLPPGTPPLPVTVRFETPTQAVPFGKTAFDDLMYLPGTVVLHCFGHEVQLVPRQLYLNRAAADWTPDTVHDLEPGDRLPSLDPPPPKGARVATNAPSSAPGSL